MIKTVIIDDEQDGIEALNKTLALFCPNVEVVATSNSPLQGIELIHLHKPELVFLDVQMPHISGFQLLEKFENIWFQVVFTTAFDHYAVRAIRYSALDYLLKPIDGEELQVAIGRMEKKLANTTIEQLTVLQEHLQKKPKFDRLAIPTAERIHFVQISDIIFCEAQTNYTLFHLKGGKKLLSSRTLKEYELTLNEDIFCRIHHASVINLTCLIEYVKGEGGYVVLEEGHHVSVSRRKKEEFLRRIM